MSALGGGPPLPSPPVNAIAALRKRFVGISSYDVLKVTPGRYKPRWVHRDQALVITGRAQLLFFVRRC